MKHLILVVFLIFTSAVSLIPLSAQSGDTPIRLNVTVEKGIGSITGIEYDSSGNTIMTAASDPIGGGSLQIWDAAAGTELSNLNVGPYSASYSPDGQLIAYSDYDLIHFIDVTTQKEASSSIEYGAARHILFSPDGRYLLTTGYDDSVRVWEITTGKEIQHFDVMAQTALYSPTGEDILIVSGDIDGKIWVRNAATGNVRLEFVASDFTVNGAAYSPDGSRIVTADFDGAKVWDANSGQKLLNLNIIGGSQLIYAVDYNASGEFIAIGCDDGTVRIFNASTGNELYRVLANGQSQRVEFVQFSPDNQHVLAAGINPSNIFVEIWDVSSVTHVSTSRMGITITILPENNPPSRPGNPEEVFNFQELDTFAATMPEVWLAAPDALPHYELSIIPIFTLWPPSCDYNVGGKLAYVTRYHVAVNLTIIDLETGEQIASKTFGADEPPACAKTESFAVGADGEPIDKTYVGSINTTGFKEWILTTLSNRDGLPAIESSSTAGETPSAASGNVPSCTGQVVSSSASVNMRGGAGTNFALVTTVKAGSRVQILAQQGNWYKVVSDGVEGWIAAQLLSLSGEDCASLPPG